MMLHAKRTQILMVDGHGREVTVERLPDLEYYRQRIYRLSDHNGLRVTGSRSLLKMLLRGGARITGRMAA